jgi:hypothetical protein
MTEDKGHNKRTGKLCNDRGLTFRQVVKLMGSSPPPNSKLEAKDRAKRRRAEKVGGRSNRDRCCWNLKGKRFELFAGGPLGLYHRCRPCPQALRTQ